MVNRVILIGNLGRDPEIRRLENGATVAKFPLATSESYRDKNGDWHDNTEWHNVVAWRALADRAERSLKKGSLVYVEGKLTHRSYQDSDGNTRYITEVVANYFRNIPQGRDAGSSPGGDSSENYSSPKEEADIMDSNGSATDGNGADDDLPF